MGDGHHEVVISAEGLPIAEKTGADVHDEGHLKALSEKTQPHKLVKQIETRDGD